MSNPDENPNRLLGEVFSIPTFLKFIKKNKQWGTLPEFLKEAPELIGIAPNIKNVLRYVLQKIARERSESMQPLGDFISAASEFVKECNAVYLPKNVSEPVIDEQFQVRTAIISLMQEIIKSLASDDPDTTPPSSAAPPQN